MGLPPLIATPMKTEQEFCGRLFHYETLTRSATMDPERRGDCDRLASRRKARDRPWRAPRRLTGLVHLDRDNMHRRRVSPKAPRGRAVRLLKQRLQKRVAAPSSAIAPGRLGRPREKFARE